ncbi:DUF2380 domain-containing protein [Vitiosangium sp. GDMCC 1.1324]|uniref:DUF2380 domain-containing protein n=1 Tax=Vitiosangium sp. (strain GDMCC 1.1324) TaxID=2138576 RepID=UPI000D33FEF2|nr:DUF2380 domain-containing protein [Vitiosangium sp. GDMCC 1.1324]PTL84757.1 DUF2380 domain-containing protein [Vitiosangium sp. GDMCC 1.1324]
MRTHPWVVLMLIMAVLTTGCASLTPPPERGRNLGYTPREELPRVLAAPSPSSLSEPEVEERLHRRRGSREVVTGAGSGERDVAEAGRQSVTLARQAVLGAVLEVSGSTRRISGELSRLKASKSGIAGRHDGLFISSVVQGERQLRWIDAELAAATRLSNTASEVDDPDMQLALLRLSGPRLEAAMLGSILLAVWVDLLNLADVVLEQCPYYSVERLFVDMERLRMMLEPTMTALASGEPGQVEAAAADLPALIGHLTGEFAATREAVRVAAKQYEKAVLVAQLLETATMVSAMRFSLPRLPPAAPVTLGVGLVVGADGVMMGTRIVVSAEWVEMMRRLVRAGVISIPVVSAAVRIHAGQVLMAQAHDELPQGVRDALGDGPEVRGMRVTGRAGAGMAEPPQHHVLPQEFREWFEKRGFTGEMDIHQFCVEMEQAHHEAIHGGGNWRLGRMWPGEWNRMIMDALYQAEAKAGRMLTWNEVLDIVAYRMRRYGIPMEFTRWRGQ